MKFPMELLLELVEHMDNTTMANLMVANKTIYALIGSHERSITKARARKFILPPNGNLLSTSGHSRTILHAASFCAISELELREHRINEVLKSHFMETASPPGIEPLTVRQQECFVAMLKRALGHCDRIADIAANTPRATLCQAVNNTSSLGFWSSATTTTTTPRSMTRNIDVVNTIQARPIQIAYFKSLPLRDLVGLYHLVTTACHGWLRAKPYMCEDPNVWEQMTVFEECVLRHGSWFLWAQMMLGGEYDGALAVKSDSLLIAGLGELTHWETGMEDALPGLRMSLLDAARASIKEVLEAQPGGGDSEEYDSENRTCVVRELYKLSPGMLTEEGETF